MYFYPPKTWNIGPAKIAFYGTFMLIGIGFLIAIFLILLKKEHFQIKWRNFIWVFLAGGLLFGLGAYGWDHLCHFLGGDGALGGISFLGGIVFGLPLFYLILVLIYPIREQRIAVMNFIFPAIVAIVLGHLIGVTGVWFYPLIGETLTLVYITIYVKIVSKKKFASLESYLCLPEGFGVPPEDALEIQITSLDDVEGAIEKVHEFCSERGESVKKDMYTALCIEEMAYNIVQHGFEEGRDNCIDIRLTDKSDEMLIRIRDNCKGFDPVKYFEIHKVDSDDPTEHIGIRMVFEMVKDVKYVNSLGLNCLTLTV